MTRAIGHAPVAAAFLLPGQTGTLFAAAFAVDSTADGTDVSPGDRICETS